MLFFKYFLPLQNIEICHTKTVCYHNFGRRNALFGVSTVESNKSTEARSIYSAIGLNPRSTTREICDLKMPAVPYLHSLKPQLSGIR